MKINIDQIQNFRVHPLGFYYLVVCSGETTRRLHLYGGNVDFSAENTWHTHQFDLKSKVLVGSIENTVAEFVTTEGTDLREFSVDYTNGKSILNETGRIGTILELAKFTTTPGQSYFIKAGTIHRAKNNSSPCVTQVTMINRGCKIFSYGVQEVPFLRRQVNTTEVSEILEILSHNGFISAT